MTIRPALQTDLPAIRQIYATARHFMAANGNPDQWGDAYPSEEIIQNDLVQGHLYVCEADQEIAGVFCYFVGIEPDYLEIYEGSWCNDASYGVVHRLASDGKRKGIASHCLEYAFSQCDNLRIDTHRNNYPMQQLLSKNGFNRCCIVHCSHGGDRIAYQKTR